MQRLVETLWRHEQRRYIKLALNWLREECYDEPLYVPSPASNGTVLMLGEDLKQAVLARRAAKEQPYDA